MALTTTQKTFEHGLGYGVFFPLTDEGYGAGVEIKGLRAQTEDPETSTTQIWADMTGTAFYSQNGATTRTTSITSLGYPEAMQTHALGKTKKNGWLINDPNQYKSFALAFAEWHVNASTGKSVYQVNVYYQLQASAPSVERAADEEDLTATEKPIECNVVTSELAGTDFASFIIDIDDPADENKWIYDSIYTQGKLVTPNDEKPADLGTQSLDFEEHTA